MPLQRVREAARPLEARDVPVRRHSGEEFGQDGQRGGKEVVLECALQPDLGELAEFGDVVEGGDEQDVEVLEEEGWQVEGGFVEGVAGAVGVFEERFDGVRGVVGHGDDLGVAFLEGG